jgi:hypothetical protein
MDPKKLFSELKRGKVFKREGINKERQANNEAFKGKN